MTRARHPGFPTAHLSVEGIEDRITPATAGTLDPSFGTGGIVTLTYPANAAITTPALDVEDSVVQSDGKILLVGTTGPDTQGANAYVSGSPSPDFAVIRLNPSGSVDTTFGVNGRVTLPFDQGTADKADFGFTIGLQSNGKIVVAGSTFVGAGVPPANNFEWAVARLNTNGSIDDTFGTSGNGEVTFAYNGKMGEGVSSMAIMPDDRIVLVGTGNPANPDQIDIARLEPTGQFDTTFGQTATSGAPAGEFFVFDTLGTLTAPLSQNVRVALEPDSSMIIAASFPDFGGDIELIHVTADGNWDTTFGNGGFVFTGLPALNKTTGAIDAIVGSVQIQSNGDILVAGGQLDGGNFDVLRYTSAGKRDTTFGTGGLVQIPFKVGGTFTDIVEGMEVQPNGDIVLGGKVQTAGGSPTISTITATYEFAAARLTPAGKLDTTFGTGGTETYAIPTDTGVGNLTGANTSIFVSGGKILLAGNDGSRAIIVQLLNNSTFNPLPPPPAPAPTVPPPVESPGTTVANLAISGSGPTVVAYPETSAGQYNTSVAVNLSVFTAYQTFIQGVTGEVRTAVGDVNGDGTPDYIVITGPGSPTKFAVLDGNNPNNFLVQPTSAFIGSESFTGGGFVSVGNLQGTGSDDIVVTPDVGGGPRVEIFSYTSASGLALQKNFLGINDPNFRGGARTAIGDINGDGIPDLAVAAGAGGGSRISIYNGSTLFTSTPTNLVNDFFAFNNNLRDGTYIAIGDVNGDGFGDLIIGSGDGGAPQVLVISGQKLISNEATAVSSPLASFFVAGDTTDRGGIRVAAKDVDGDNKADVVVSSGVGDPPLVRVYLGANFTGTGEPKVFQSLDPFGTASEPDGIYVG